MTVSYRCDAGIAVLTLDDVPKRNALSRRMVQRLNDCLDRAQREGARAIVISANGPSFCAGANIDDLRTGWMEGGDPDTDPLQFFKRLAEHPRITVAAVQGIAAGGGLEMTLACDLVVAGPAAGFIAPELGHGVIPPLGLALLPSIVGRHRAMDMILSRRKVSAKEACAIGLATHSAEDEKVEPAAIELARSIVHAIPPGALSVAKRQIARYQELDWGTILNSPREVPAAEWREGLNAFVEKRKADYTPFWEIADKSQNSID